MSRMSDSCDSTTGGIVEGAVVSSTEMSMAASSTESADRSTAGTETWGSSAGVVLLLLSCCWDESGLSDEGGEASVGCDSAGISGGGMATAWFAANEWIFASVAPFAANGVSVVAVASTGSCGARSREGWFSARTSVGAGAAELKGLVSSGLELLQKVQLISTRYTEEDRTEKERETEKETDTQGQSKNNNNDELEEADSPVDLEIQGHHVCRWNGDGLVLQRDALSMLRGHDGHVSLGSPSEGSGAPIEVPTQQGRPRFSARAGASGMGLSFKGSCRARSGRSGRMYLGDLECAGLR